MGEVPKIESEKKSYVQKVLTAIEEVEASIQSKMFKTGNSWPAYFIDRIQVFNSNIGFAYRSGEINKECKEKVESMINDLTRKIELMKVNDSKELQGLEGEERMKKIKQIEPASEEKEKIFADLVAVGNELLRGKIEN